MLSANMSAYLATATVLTIAPGLDTAMVLRSATHGGVWSGGATALGIAMGCFCWGSAAAFGVGALLLSAPLAFVVLKWAGATYLGWLGVKLLIWPRRALTTAANPTPEREALVHAFGRGLATNLLNPKVGLFYLTLLPQFVSTPGDRGGAAALGLASIHVLIALTWFVGLSAITGRIAPLLRRPKVMTMIDRVTGAVFVVIGVNLTLTAGLAA